jgi:tetratricopeptide (TPR) repeat protein
MKLRSNLKGIFICLLGVFLVLSFSSQLMAQPKTATKNKTGTRLSEPVKKDADYWFKKGALVSTYGNNKAAIQYFQKAIALNPNFSGAYFSQGVSYGQLGQYPEAINQINRAIKMEPQNGMYYYGRARVYLLSGDKAKAMEDFKKAADLGDEDALDYLNYIGQKKN